MSITIMRSLNETVTQLRAGKPILVIDDVASVAAGYLVAPAASITEENIAFFVNVARGIIWIALPESRVRELGLSSFPTRGTRPPLDFTISVEARQGVSTGISAADRARTARIIATTIDAKLDLVMPGHMFPVRAVTGGVLVRTGAAEAATDLLTIAQLNPAAVISLCLNDRGDVSSLDDLTALASTHGLSSVTISSLIGHQLAEHAIVERVSEARLPTKSAGEFLAICFESKTDYTEHLALVKGDLTAAGTKGVLVRVQAENRVGDLIGTKTFLQRKSTQAALEAINREQQGVFVYIRHSRKGSLVTQLQSSRGGTENSSRPQELRELGIGAQILQQLGVHKIRLLTNSTREIAGAAAFKLDIAERVPFSLAPQ